MHLEEGYLRDAAQELQEVVNELIDAWARTNHSYRWQIGRMIWQVGGRGCSLIKSVRERSGGVEDCVRVYSV